MEQLSETALDLRKSAIRDFPCYVQFYADEHKYWAVGVVDEIDDYYWLTVNKDFSLEFHSCVGGYTVCEDQTGFMDGKLEDPEFVEVLKQRIANEVSDVGEAWLKKLSKKKGKFYKKVPKWEKMKDSLLKRIKQPLESQGVVYLKIKRESD